MGRSILILGGARSGKSSFAEGLADAMSGKFTYIATAQAFDEEMADRIARHQAGRANYWSTLECPIDLPATLDRLAAPDNVILIDCLTLWLSNLMLGDHDIVAARLALVESVKRSPATILLVSNEVGQGIVPDNPLARRFRDEAGWLHQAVTQSADEVWFLIAGLAQRLK